MLLYRGVHPHQILKTDVWQILESGYYDKINKEITFIAIDIKSTIIDMKYFMANISIKCITFYQV